MIFGTSQEPPVLRDGEVHLWRAAVDAGVGRGSPGWLSDAERRRAEAFRFERDRGRYVARTVFLRGVLGACLGRDPAALTFVLGSSKKPALEGAELRFNLSHSAGQVLLAVARGREVGVDVEATARSGDVVRLARRVFDAAEREALAAAADERAAFFRGWTRKEAALKALGTGFHREPASLHVGLDLRPLTERWVPDSDFADFGALMDLPAPDGFAAALAAEGDDWTLVEAGPP